MVAEARLRQPRPTRQLWLVASSAPAVCIALDRMNSDSETPCDFAVSASISRSQGRSLTATRAVRCLDSERLRGMPCSRFPALLTAIFLPPAGPFVRLLGRIRSWNLNLRYNRAGVSRRLYRVGV